MKKTISIAMAVICVLSILSACGSSGGTAENESTITAEKQSSEDYVVRSVKWGMSRDEVMAAENDDVSEQKGKATELYYDVRMFDVTFKLHYNFKNQKLESINYTASISSTDLAYDLADNITKTLNEKYGKPHESDMDSALDGTQIWLTTDTKIKLWVRENEGKTNFIITYTPSSEGNKSDNSNL